MRETPQFLRLELRGFAVEALFRHRSAGLWTSPQADLVSNAGGCRSALPNRACRDLSVQQRTVERLNFRCRKLPKESRNQMRTDVPGQQARVIAEALGSQPRPSTDVKPVIEILTDCYTHAVLFSALRQAVRWKLLLTNPAEEVYLPRQPRRRFTVFDVGQARQFIAAISGHEYEALFALALTSGMRPSEYLALTWMDFNLECGTVSVSKTLEWRKGGWSFEDTKRERSRRMIKLQNWV
jgi:integrase